MIKVPEPGIQQISVTSSEHAVKDAHFWKRALAFFPDATHHHQWQWGEIIENCFGYPACRLIATRGDTILGLLTLVEINSLLVGRALISVPYLNGGGILTRDPVATQTLLDHATTLQTDRQSRYVELRHRGPDLDRIPHWRGKSHKVAMELVLSPDPGEIFSLFPSKLRSQIRRSTKSGAHSHIRFGNDFPSRELDGFYSVFSYNMRDLGTPTYPKALFASTLKMFQRHARLITVWIGNECTAGGITVGVGSSTELLWGSSLRYCNHLSTNMLMYWEAIRHACLDGYKIFDFGRSSPNSGTFRFKQQWGAVATPLHWYYHLAPGAALPQLDPKSPKYRAMTSLWRHLPLSITRGIGPWLTRSLP